MKRNNKGCSLVELLVSFAILGVISAIIGIMMTSGSNMFSRNRARLNLQYKSQVIASQVHTYLQNCNGGVAVDTNGDLYIAQKKSSDSDPDYVGCVYMLALGADSDADKLYLRRFDIRTQPEVGGGVKFTASYELQEGGSQTVEEIGSDDFANCFAQPMCSDVASWNTVLNAKYAKIDMNFNQNNITYTKNIAESFRNRPVIVSASEAGGNQLINTLIERVWR